MPKRFATQFDTRARVPENLGSPVKQLYAPVFDDRGVMHLRENGKHDLYGEIQSHKDSVDIHVLLTRYQNGDVEALNRVQGAYGDFTQMPKTFAEALNVFMAAEQCFKSLPVEVRAKYGHDFNQFISSIDTPTFAEDIGLVKPGPDPEQVSDAIKDVQKKSEAVSSTVPSASASVETVAS